MRDRLRGIKVVITDIDGVWTDGGMYYTAEGDVMKRFNTRDGMGVARLRAIGVDTVIATSEDTVIVRRRAEKLGIAHCFVGVEDKARVLDEVCGTLAVVPAQVACLGDDVNDLPLIERVGVSACPSDAFELVRRTVDHVCTRRGGEGVFREFAEMIVEECAGG